MAKALPLEQISLFDKLNPPVSDFDYGTAAILLVYKPRGWTSFDVVKYVRNRLRTRKVGHAGTLDPMAEGLLILCSGRATKSISQLQDMEKTYLAEITFGASTPTYDAESEPDAAAPFEHITPELICEAMETQFLGTIMQKPPVYSALKVKGQPMYKLARLGEAVDPEPRPVTIHEYKLINFSNNKLELSITCGKGTYIRSLAHDLGLALNSRAHLSGLHRTKTGKYDSASALTPEEIDKLLTNHG